MLTRKEAQEEAVLSVIHVNDEPIGSGSIRQMVADRGLAISEATVGRILKELDQKDYTVKKGFQGRILTQKGYERLCELKHRREHTTIRKELEETLSPENKKNMLDMLVARRAIEGEIAALAAIHITSQEIEAMERVLAHHELHRQRGQYGVEQDIHFHQLLARASRNRVLEKAMDLILQSGRRSPTLEFIRKEVNGNIIEDHLRIFEAIKEKNPDRARSAMISHMENVTRDVTLYWKSH
ncbi:FCD domain-containing protein [Heliobacillus mobilis]|uniref:FCD domain-containing protein n=1 Tax=Heliobacterium mobile TaxID=28064 RepID=A0A6I3SJ12_HELMO|nr:FCD domain-containing protein [Heliobacterium mobile]MTV48879.1 FCD domain-containing protein [Heliobacterium mobile]